ncbi:MAG: hypothetical protein WCI20_06040 [bacterium]
MRHFLLLTVLFCTFVTSVRAGSITNQPPRFTKDELQSLYPKKLEGFENEGGIYQSRDNVLDSGWGYNRCERSYSDGKKRFLNVEVRDSGGFTKEFIADHEYLRLPVGEKDINSQTVILINGNRGQTYKEAGRWQNIVLMATLDRFEIEVKDDAGLPLERLKAIALEFEAAIKAKLASPTKAK